MRILPIHSEIEKYLKIRKLEKKFEKQINLYKDFKSELEARLEG